MMTDNELDNLFKNTFSDHESPIPGDMWQRIQPGRTKKRPILLWWKWYAVAAVILIGSSIATWWYTHPAGANNNKVIAYKIGSNKENNSNANQDADIKRDTNTSLQQNNSSDKQPTNTNKLTDKEQQLSLSYINNQKDNIQDKSHLNSSVSKNLNVNDLNAPDLSRMFDKKSPGNDNNRQGSNQNNSSTISKQAPTSPAPSIANTESSTVNNNIPNQNTSANNETHSVANNIKKDNYKVKLPWTFEAFATTAYADKQTYDVEKVNTIGMGAPITPHQPKPSLWNYGAGVRLGIPISTKFTFKTGLQFAQTIQKADYQQQNVVDMISVRGGDTSFYRQIVLETETQKSTYNSLSVPVLVSYQTGKKIEVGATAGLIVNAYSWYSGNVPNANYTTTLSSKDTYKHNTGAALYAGVTVAKKLGAVDIFVEPHLQYSLSSITKPTVPFKQKINTYGISIGVRTRLHK